ncbi:hypothetical protein C8R46DRAFT_482182 [Mycena filopes]|nr:hypothetical protein C8R46DRAFT_482182 [Mycena filopes]
MTTSPQKMNPEENHVWDVAFRGHENRIVALTVMVWEYLITLEDERQLFWKRRPWTLATFFFLWNRYVGIILTSVGVVVAVWPTPSDSVDPVTRGSDWRRGSEYPSRGPLRNLRIVRWIPTYTCPPDRRLLRGSSDRHRRVRPRLCGQ